MSLPVKAHGVAKKVEGGCGLRCSCARISAGASRQDRCGLDAMFANVANSLKDDFGEADRSFAWPSRVRGFGLIR